MVGGPGRPLTVGTVEKAQLAADLAGNSRRHAAGRAGPLTEGDAGGRRACLGQQSLIRSLTSGFGGGQLIEPAREVVGPACAEAVGVVRLSAPAARAAEIIALTTTRLT
jgi:hypothetical protein